MNKVQGTARSVRELLSGAKYAIDYYQREYKWERPQVTALLDDLASKFLEKYAPEDPRQAVEGYSHYFLGSIIISSKDGASFIVDGQQRLTTLTLLLIHLNNLQQARTDEDRVAIDDLIFSTKYGHKSFNIQVDEREQCMNALYEGHDFDIEGQTEAVANLVARFRDIETFFSEELTGEALLYFIDWLIENVHLVEITAFSDGDAYTIFETMNDRGLSLNPVDMLKGYLLANIDGTHDGGKKRSQLNEKWKRRVQQLARAGKEVDADFFKSWLRSQHGLTIRERKKDAPAGDFDRIGSEFHRWVRNEKSALGLEGSNDFAAFIEQDFDFYSKQYLRILEYSNKYTKGAESIYYNAQLGFTLQPMLLLAPITTRDDQATVDLKWRLVAKYIDILLIRRIWNYRTTGQSTMKYPAFVTMLDIRAMEPEDIARKLHARLVERDEEEAFNNQFALHGMNGYQISHILARMTSWLEVGSGEPDHFATYTGSTGAKRYEVEHIWANKFEEHKDEFSHDADFASYRNRIGGLLLLPKSFNASFGALPYADKMPKYIEQNYLARTLNPAFYSNNPGFFALSKRTGLPFRAHTAFTRADLDMRNDLYRQIAEQIWDPQQLLREVGL